LSKRLLENMLGRTSLVCAIWREIETELMRGSKLEDGYLKREFNDRSTSLLLIATYPGTWSVFILCLKTA
jgi:hypothetical protein